MGQYYTLVNLDKKERLCPMDSNSGLKLMELASGSDGVMALLAGMLKVGNPWFANRIVITGDYADEGKFVGPEHAGFNLYSVAQGINEENFDNVLESQRSDAYAKAQSDALKCLETLGTETSKSLIEKAWPVQFKYSWCSVNTNPKYRWALNPDLWTKLKFSDFDEFLDFMQCSVSLDPEVLATNLQSAINWSALFEKIEDIRKPKSFLNEGIEKPAGKDKTEVPLRMSDGKEVTLKFPCTASSLFKHFGLTAEKFKKARGICDVPLLAN